MTGRLADELARVAERAPVIDIPTDTWARARRARTRDRALVVAAVAAVLALVVGVALLPRLDRSVPVAHGSAGAGVPSQVWGVPERLTMQDENGAWSSDRVESDLAIGRGAVAFVTQGGLPVVVGAEDGAYHLLDLPDFLGNSVFTRVDSVAMSLSPDGRQLAYAWSGKLPTTDVVPVPSGVRVLDLATGDVRNVPLSGGVGVLVLRLAWSPESSWLVWQGRVASSWTESSTAFSSNAAGRIAPGATTSEDVPTSSAQAVSVIDDDGAVSSLTSRRVTTWDGREVSGIRLRDVQQVSSAALQPSGGLAVIGRDLTSHGIRSVDLRTGEVVTHPYLAGLAPNGAVSAPLGWVDDDLLVALVSPSVDGNGNLPDSQIVVTTPRRGKTSTYRIVARVDATVADATGPSLTPTLSLAVDLMTLDRPTVERPEPNWPWSDERLSLTIGLGVAGALSVLWGIRWLWRRRAL